MNFKLALVLFCSALSTVAAKANDESSSSILSKRVVIMKVDVSPSHLVHSRAGYSSEVLKINVEELADNTFLNHRNTAANGPCLATNDTMNPSDIIKGSPGIEEVKAIITLTKVLEPDSAAQVCKVSLLEQVTMNIRGFKFYHHQAAPLPDRLLADCR